MKSKQVMAILLTAIMTLSSCMPINCMTAFAAENAAEESTEAITDDEIETESLDESEAQEETNTDLDNM